MSEKLFVDLRNSRSREMKRKKAVEIEDAGAKREKKQVKINDKNNHKQNGEKSRPSNSIGFYN